MFFKHGSNIWVDISYRLRASGGAEGVVEEAIYEFGHKAPAKKQRLPAHLDRIEFGFVATEPELLCLRGIGLRSG